MASKQKLTKKSISKPAATPPKLHKRFIYGAGTVVVALAATVGFMVYGGPADEPLLARLGSALTGLPSINTTETSYTTLGAATSTSVLVKFKSSTSTATADSAHQKIGGKVKRRINGIGAHVVELSGSKPVGETLGEYRARGDVEYAEPNYMSRAFFTPSDAEYGRQWGLAKIGAAQAWDVSQVSAGRVAVIDTGIDPSHPDLKGQLTTGFDFVTDTANVIDENGHGTHVAGIIGGATNNGAGVASIGFKANIMPVKVLDATGSGNYGDVASGIIYAADNGATIINLSLGGSSSSRTLQDAINYALGRGIIVVAAAGNNGTNAAVYPAAYPGVLAVAASTSSDTLASFSSYGSAVAVAAPGVGIISTYKTGGYASLSGTSMAAPMVAGLLALAQSANPSAAAVQTTLRQTADKIGPYSYDANGWNQYFGYGRINAGKLLAQLGAPVSTPAPVASPTPSPTATPKPPVANQFNVTLDATIDAVGSGYLSVKIKSGNDALGLTAGTLVTLYTTPDTAFKSGSQTLLMADLKPGDRLIAKATWLSSKLTAISATVHLAPAASPEGTSPSTGQGNTHGNGSSNRRNH